MNSNFIVKKVKSILAPVQYSAGEYFEEEDNIKIKTEPVSVKTEPLIKTEPVFLKTEPIAPVMAESDDPDDPPPISTNLTFKKSPMSVNMSHTSHSKPKVERLMDCILCSSKDGKRLRIESLKSHMSVCLYNKEPEYYKTILPPRHSTSMLNDTVCLNRRRNS